MSKWTLGEYNYLDNLVRLAEHSSRGQVGMPAPVFLPPSPAFAIRRAHIALY